MWLVVSSSCSPCWDAGLRAQTGELCGSYFGGHRSVLLCLLVCLAFVGHVPLILANGLLPISYFGLSEEYPTIILRVFRVTVPTPCAHDDRWLSLCPIHSPVSTLAEECMKVSLHFLGEHLVALTLWLPTSECMFQDYCALLWQLPFWNSANVICTICRYTFFWVLLLASKFAFSYFIQVSFFFHNWQFWHSEIESQQVCFIDW